MVERFEALILAQLVIMLGSRYSHRSESTKCSLFYIFMIISFVFMMLKKIIMIKNFCRDILIYKIIKKRIV